MTKKIPFDLERLQKGNCKLVTRDGKYPTEWHYFKTANENNCIFYITEGNYEYTSKDGRYLDSKRESEEDLLLEVEVEETVWFANHYQGGIGSFPFKSLEEAININQGSAIAVQKTTIIGNDISIEIVHKY